MPPLMVSTAGSTAVQAMQMPKRMIQTSFSSSTDVIWHALGGKGWNTAAEHAPMPQAQCADDWSVEHVQRSV
jgi:hypothetical protein